MDESAADLADLCQCCYRSIGKPCGKCLATPGPAAYGGVLFKFCDYRGCLVVLLLIGAPLLMAGVTLWDQYVVQENRQNSYHETQCPLLTIGYAYNSSCNDSVNTYDLNGYYVPNCSTLLDETGSSLIISTSNLTDWMHHLIADQLDVCVNQANDSISDEYHNTTTGIEWDEYLECWVDDQCVNVLSHQPPPANPWPALLCMCLGILTMLIWIWVLCWKCGCLLRICQKIDTLAGHDVPDASHKQYAPVSTV